MKIIKTIKIMVASLAVMGCTISTSFAGDSSSTSPDPRYGGYGNGYGFMALGGVTIALGAFTTRPDRYYNGSIWVDKPFHRQGPRASAIVCGVTLTITGLIGAIVNK